MNKEIKEKWIQALESGEYKKGTERLKTPEGYCCLGVLCDIYAKETELGSWSGNNFKVNTNHFNHIAVLPQDVLKWAGLRFNNPLIDHSNEYIKSIAEVNDHESPSGTFKEVIEIIKEQL